MDHFTVHSFFNENRPNTFWRTGLGVECVRKRCASSAVECTTVLACAREQKRRRWSGRYSICLGKRQVKSSTTIFDCSSPLIIRHGCSTKCFHCKVIGHAVDFLLGGKADAYSVNSRLLPPLEYAVRDLCFIVAF